MPTVRKSVLVFHPAEAMFELVDAVEHYPDFLPWCGGSQLIERTPELTVGRVDIDYRGLKSSITTRNRKQHPEWMHLDFVDGPFQTFAGHWHFVALGDAGCRVEFALDYGFDNRALDAVVAPVFGHIMETLVDRFVARADEVARK